MQNITRDKYFHEINLSYKSILRFSPFLSFLFMYKVASNLYDCITVNIIYNVHKYFPIVI